MTEKKKLPRSNLEEMNNTEFSNAREDKVRKMCRKLPKSLFEAVADDDIEGMILLYAAMGRDTIISHYSSCKRRLGIVDRSFHKGNEEKVDEFFNYINQDDMIPPQSNSKRQHYPAGSGPPTHIGSNFFTNIAKDDDIFPSKVVSQLEALLAIDCNSNQKLSRETFLDDLAIGSYGKKHNLKRSTFQKSGHSTDDKYQIPSGVGLNDEKKIRKASFNEMNKVNKFKFDDEIEEEVECLLQQSAGILSNSRPPSSFIVLDRSHIVKRKQLEKVNAQGKLKSDYEDNKVFQRQEYNSTASRGKEVEKAALFDGSVAISTPGFGSITGGGIGTALHLACALDSTFVLAVLLVMHADASSRHTAFRRLLIHEAACSDSPDCLCLLLEIAKQYCDEISSKDVEPKKGTHSCRRTIFGGWGRKKMSKDSNVFKDKSNECDDAKEIPFLSTLEFMLDLAHNIKKGKISDTDAARELLLHVSISEGNKSWLVSSCSPVTLETTRVRSMFTADTPLQLQSNTDGHGNTALHWASFKNSVSCVSLLLQYSFDVNSKAEPSGWTPLHDASYSNSAESVSLLIAAGANVNSKANSGATPLCFAAQEDAPAAAKCLLEAGADPSVRCCGHQQIYNQNHHNSRFSGYTPLHYCAHYNAHKAAKVLLDHDLGKHGVTGHGLLEIFDLNEKLPIHIAVLRGSSDVLRELLHAGARIVSKSHSLSTNKSDQDHGAVHQDLNYQYLNSVAVIPLDTSAGPVAQVDEEEDVSPSAGTLVSSPALESLIPSRPVTSSKPWNCLSQRSIDECRMLIHDVELNWSPERHSLFPPSDRRAVLELLRVGKRFEQMGSGIFIELWPLVLSFCGRGWFDIDEPNTVSLESDDENTDITSGHVVSVKEDTKVG